MNSVERVKLLCKERMIPISRLERDLGYSNGYIGQLRKGVFPTDRLVEIAEYLCVSVEYLLGTSERKAPAPEGEHKPKLRSVARLESADITPEMDKHIANYIDFLLKERDGQE